MGNERRLKSLVSSKDGEIAELHRELNSMRASLTWKVGSVFRGVFDFLFNNRFTSKYYHKTIFKLTHGFKKVRKLAANSNLGRIQRIEVDYLNKPIPNKFSKLSSSRIVLIVAELSIPQCKRYRVDQKVEALDKLGYDVFVFSFTDTNNVMMILSFAKMVLFYRTPYWDGVKFMIGECKRMGIPTVYDIDDLIFDVDEYSNHPALKQLPKNEVNNLLSGAKDSQKCLEACDHAMASTRELAKFMRKYNKGKVFILENALDDISLDILKYEKHHSKYSDGKLIIGYGSGTKTHDADFELASSALVRILKEFSNIKLVIQGPLILPQELEEFAERIERVDLLPASEYLQSLCDFDINLAPLTKSIFNDSKSNIKFLEAAVLGIPTIASPADAFSQVMIHGVNGLMASNDDDWYRSLKMLIENNEAREVIGKKAKEMALDLYSPENTEQKFAEIMMNLGLDIDKKVASVKKKILLVNIFYAPLSFGGATLVVENLAEKLVENYDVAVFTTNNFANKLFYETVKYEKKGVLVYSTTVDGWSAERDLGNLGVEGAFGKTLNDFNPDIVHFHSIQGMGIGLLKMAKEFGAKTVVTAHDSWWFCKRQFRVTDNRKFCGYDKIDLRQCGRCVGNFGEVLKRFRSMQEFLFETDLILSPSSYQNDVMMANFSIKGKMAVNKNGIRLPSYGYKHKKLDKELIRFAFIGGIGAFAKGYDFVKKAFEKIDEEKYELWIVDVDHKLGSPVKKLDKWNVKGKVKIVEPFSEDKMDDFYSNIDVLLTPSQCPEGFGLAPREALARGVYVIATRSGGIIEDLENCSNCTLLNIGDLEEFIKVLKDLINHPEKLANLKLEKFDDFKSQSENLAEFYDKLLS